MSAQPNPVPPLRPQLFAQCALPPERAEEVHALVSRIRSYYIAVGKSRTPGKPSTREVLGILVLLGIDVFTDTTLGREISRYERKQRRAQIDPNTGKPYIFCKDCEQPTLPPGMKKKKGEYDHATGCPSDVKTKGV